MMTPRTPTLAFAAACAAAAVAVAQPTTAPAETPASIAPASSPPTAVPAAAKPTAAPAYTSPRWDEDYGYLAKQPGTDLFDPIKYVPFGALGDDGFYASFGGQARFRYEFLNNENFGAVRNDSGYFLQRYLLHADVHLSPYFRVFGQIKSSLVDDGREPPAVTRGTDADEFDLQQLFVDGRVPLGDKDAFVLRAGRQDLIYGAQRLISPLDWTNVRRTFEGVKGSLAFGPQTLDAFLVRPVIVDKEEPNQGNGDVAFAGVYDTVKLPGLIREKDGTQLEVYLLGLWTESLVDSDTYTAGVRFSSKPAPFDFDVELDYQFGTRGGDRISAYSVALEGGYAFADVAFKPRPYVGFDYASGDDDPADGNYNTFNQLFPLGHAYFGFIDVVGRQNIIDLHPGAELTLLENKSCAKKLTARADYHLFWRADTDDALYNASGAVLRADAGTDASFVGSEADLLLTWNIDRHLLAYAGYSHFFTGDFVRSSAGPDDGIDFVYAAVQYTF